jgi:hypothetical protein
MSKFVLPWNASIYKICASRRSRICHGYVKPSMAVKVRTRNIPMRLPSMKLDLGTFFGKAASGKEGFSCSL